LKDGAVSERSYLEEISIRNLGIIDQSELELGPGLNVLTGETGAGKTMILTALSLVLGGKSDSALVRHGSDRLVASATFSVPKGLHSDLEEVGAVIEDGSLIITSQVPIERWYETVGDPTLADAILDRLVHSAYRIELKGESLRKQRAAA
jgi:DNA repair protein RecN (Recombination protein N)